MILLIIIFLILYCFLYYEISNLRNDFNNFRKTVSKNLNLEENNQENKTSEIIQKDEPEIKNEESDFCLEILENNQDEDKEINYEKLFLGNIFNKIGAIVLIIAICIFVKLAGEYIKFTPIMQILSGFIISIGLICTSLKLHKKDMKNYAEVVCGIGIAGFLISLYAGVSFYNIIPCAFAAFLGGLLIILSYLISLRYHTFSTMLIGLLGGYLNPFFVNQNPSVDFLFGYLIFVNLVSIFYTYKNQDKNSLNIINLFLSAFMLAGYSYNKEISIIYPLLMWLIYFIYDLSALIKDRYDNNFKTLNWINFFVLILFVNIIFTFKNKIPLGFVILGFGIIYSFAAIYIMKFKSKDNKIHLQNALLAFLFSTCFLSSPVLRPCIIAIESLILAYLYKKIQFHDFKNYSLVYSFISFISVFFAGNILIESYAFNYLIPALCFFINSYLFKENNQNMADIFKLLSIFLVYLCVIFEFCNFSGELVIYSIIAIIAFIFSINLNYLFRSSKNTLFLIPALIVFFVSYILLLITKFDTAFHQEDLIPFLNLRFAANILSVIAAYYFAKNRNFGFANYLAIIFSVICIFDEFNMLFLNSPLDIIYTNANILTSSVLMLYFALILVYGISKNIKYYTISGIWLALICAAKIIFYDLEYIETIIKLLACIIVGVSFMGVSYYYTKIKKG